MNSALRFTRIKVQNVGILGEREIELDSLSPGINVISGPNECGKSSIVRALRAALFQRHNSGHALIKALQPYNSKVAPQVEVDFEVDGIAYQLEKRFLRKGMARVRARDGSIDLEGDAADQWLFERLGAREPAKKGVNFDDMGVWGLLWVNQDAYATDQPSEMMGDNMRGALSSTIGALVGNVMGGEYGVALKRAIEDEHDRYWTAKNQEATDRLAAARKKHADLDATVKSLKIREDETTRLGEQLQEREQDVQTLEADIASLQDALRAREVEEREGDALERERDEAAKALQDAEQTLASAASRNDARGEARNRLTQEEEALRVRTELAERLRADHLRRQAVLHTETAAATTIRRDVDALREAVDGHRRRLDALRARNELRQLDASLAEGRRLDAAIRAGKEALRGLPDADALSQITRLERDRAEHSERIARSATRVLVQQDGSEEHIAVSTRRSVALGALGQITIDPPREGFLAARVAWKSSRERLVAHLEALRVASVSAARELAAEHQRLTTEIESRRVRIEALAPKGFASLSQECDRAESTAIGLARHRDDVLAQRDEVSGMDQELAAFRIGEAEVQSLIDLEARVRSLAALEANAAVWVSMRPLAAVRVQVGSREPPRLLTAGADVRRPIAAPTTLVIDDKLQIEIDPGAAATAAGVDDAQRELTARLAELDIASVEDARRVARARAALQGRRDQVEQTIQSKAPLGVDVLLDRVARSVRAADDLRRQRDDAQALVTEIAAFEGQRAEIPMRPGDFQSLDELDRKCFAEEQALRRLAGRIVASEGPISAEISGNEDLIDAVTFALGSARVEIVPGEVPHDVELPMIERELAARLKAYNLTSLEDAQRAHRAWIERSTQLEADRQALSRLAPQGVAAIDADAARVRARLGAEVPEDALRDTIERELDVASERLDARKLERVTAEARTESARVEEESARVAYMTAERERVEQTARHRAMAEQLRAEESVATDGALRDAAVGARVNVQARQARFEAAARACDAALPEVRRADRDRARASLDDATRRLHSTREACARDKGTLEGRLGEGYHDQLAAADAACQAAQAELAHVEREARVVKLLRDTALKAYGEAQSTLMEPVNKEAMPLLQLIRPGTTFRMNKDTMQLEQVLRGGFEEEFKDLSGGAREQLAVVVRIALAKVFARQHRALPLILDDILGWTDDRRLRAMLNVLERTAQDLQVILLTCHPSRFRGLSGARTYALDEMKATT